MVATSGSDARTAGASYETHLQSLRDFAEEVRHQISALAATKEAVEGLAAHAVLLGHFLEADLLLERHGEALAQVRALLVGIEKALGFAEQVTDVVANSYEREDLETAALFSGARAEA
ncbi:MAG: hypothetical protein ACFCVF_10430 [Kineosporiaceae bacterium]